MRCGELCPLGSGSEEHTRCEAYRTFTSVMRVDGFLSRCRCWNWAKLNGQLFCAHCQPIEVCEGMCSANSEHTQAFRVRNVSSDCSDTKSAKKKKRSGGRCHGDGGERAGE